MEKLRALERVAELEKRLGKMNLSSVKPSDSGTKSAEPPAAAAGRGRGKPQQKKDRAPAAARARHVPETAKAAKPLMTAAAARPGGEPDAEHAARTEVQEGEAH